MLLGWIHTTTDGSLNTEEWTHPLNICTDSLSLFTSPFSFIQPADASEPLWEWRRAENGGWMDRKGERTMGMGGRMGCGCKCRSGSKSVSQMVWRRSQHKRSWCVWLFSGLQFLCVFVGNAYVCVSGGETTPFFRGSLGSGGWGGGWQWGGVQGALSSLIASWAQSPSQGAGHFAVFTEGEKRRGRRRMWRSLRGDNFHLSFSPTILLLLQRLFFRVNTACRGGWDGVAWWWGAF